MQFKKDSKRMALRSRERKGKIMTINSLKSYKIRSSKVKESLPVNHTLDLTDILETLKFKKDASNGLSSEKMQYHIDKTHPRVLEVDPICNNSSRFIFINRWACDLQKTLNLLLKYGKPLLFKRVQKVRIRSLWTRCSNLFPICEVYDLGRSSADNFKHSPIYFLLQWQRDEQIKYFRHERHFFCLHTG